MSSKDAYEPKEALAPENIMPGNPFAFPNVHYIPPQMEQVNALMALAYEQRTANLIALLDWLPSPQPLKLREQIAARLGIEVQQPEQPF